MDLCELFDIDDFISRWHISIPDVWFNKIEGASPKDLRMFLKLLKAKKRELLKQQVFNIVKEFKLYHMLRRAIAHELTCRSSIRKKMFNTLLPIKKKVAWFVAHKKQNYQWEKFIFYEYVDTGNLLYKPMCFYGKNLASFWIAHYKVIIYAIIGIVGICVQVIKK